MASYVNECLRVCKWLPRVAKATVPMLPFGPGVP